MYHIAWQSMIIEVFIFVIIGILAAISLRFYTQKMHTTNNETKKDSDSSNVV